MRWGSPLWRIGCCALVRSLPGCWRLALRSSGRRLAAGALVRSSGCCLAAGALVRFFGGVRAQVFGVRASHSQGGFPTLSVVGRAFAVDCRSGHCADPVVVLSQGCVGLARWVFPSAGSPGLARRLFPCAGSPVPFALEPGCARCALSPIRCSASPKTNTTTTTLWCSHKNYG